MAIMAREMPLRRVVIKEELVALTGDFMEALVLNQLLYWSRRTRDYVQLMAEELMRTQKCVETAADWRPVHDWIYKKSEEMAQELMVGCSATTIRRVINRLLAKGLLWERNNPGAGWDRTKQYRVNLLGLHRQLAVMGYSLEGFELSTGSYGQTVVRPTSGLQAAGSKPQVAAYGKQAGAIEVQSEACNAQAEAAIPKTTPDITAKNKKNTQRYCAGTSAAQEDDECVSVFLLADNEYDKEETDEDGIAYSPDFEAFWSIYPKRINKWQAWGEWRAALERRHPKPVTAQQLLLATMNYAQYAAAIEHRYVMLPATFLGSGRRYLEYIDTAWPGTEEAADSDAGLSRGAAVALVQTINMAPPAILEQTHQNVRWRLQSQGYDIGFAGGLYFLRE